MSASHQLARCLRKNPPDTKPTVWLVRGTITTEDAAATYREQGFDVKVGDVEWQFSDGPPGDRWSSADYACIVRGIEDHKHCIIDLRYA